MDIVRIGSDDCDMEECNEECNTVEKKLID